MPSATGGVPGRTYYLTHEWGHSVDEVPWEWLDEGENPGIYKGTPLWDLLQARKAPSRCTSRGTDGPTRRRRYAEFYAEWMLTQGHPLQKDG